MLQWDAETGRLWCGAQGTVFADGPYVYRVRGTRSGREAVADGLARRTVCADGERVRIQGVLDPLQIEVTHLFQKTPDGLDETVAFRNLASEAVTLADIGLGFSATLGNRAGWRLCAIPFRVQLDGSRHDYSAAALAEGRFQNAIYRDETRPEPELVEEGRLRSEAWAWWAEGQGLLVAKYNNADIELSVAAPFARDGEKALRFGGVGTCLYREPARGHLLEAGASFAFGTTHYRIVDGPIEAAFVRYRALLRARGHGFPADYNPPVNWNELYDVGWHHSNPQALAAHYTRDALLAEAAKARDCGCELLYLDPGWEVAEGATLWDEKRLGTAASLVARLRDDYGLQLGFRSILRCYRDHWERRGWVRHETGTAGPVTQNRLMFWELCLCDPQVWKRKCDRIADIARQGTRFLMIDEMDWRGPCTDPDHGHAVSTTASDHVRAVYALCRELKRRCPELTIECHDPVWPWHTCVYVPTYFQQGFGAQGAYDENWGFEYMWNCLNDLKSGKALALYYYNLACDIPLYLHITMAADNDNCLFFWWAASTVRHLGIGGKYGSDSVFHKNDVAYDPERRFAAYRESLALYRSLKPFFTRGVFHGLDEHMHLHTLPGSAGGVLLLFNVGDGERTLEARIDAAILRMDDGDTRVAGAEARMTGGVLCVRKTVPAMSAAVIRIGDAV